MSRNERGKREKKSISYKEDLYSEEDEILSEEESEEQNQVKQTKKKKNKKDDDSEDFELDDEEDEPEDEVISENEEEPDEDYGKKIKPGRKRQVKEKLEVVVETKEKKKRGRKKAENKEVLVKETKTTVTKTKTVKTPAVKKEKFILDPAFNLERDYFYQDLSEQDKSEITGFFAGYFGDGNKSVKDVGEFLGKYTILRKNKSNIDFAQNE